MQSFTVRYGAIVVLQCLLLLTVAGFKQYTVATGRTVLLKVEPIDPRSLFSGDYVSLNYEISTIDCQSLCRPTALRRGPVYVELAGGSDGYWHVISLSMSAHDVSSQDVLIKGKMDSSQAYDCTRCRANYGIEDVYVPEGSGAAVERERGGIGVEVTVDRFGNAQAQRLLLDGQPLKLKSR
jgi:uncharacterized membrane-anchored protein